MKKLFALLCAIAYITIEKICNPQDLYIARHTLYEIKKKLKGENNDDKKN